ncbi:MAG: hypothetical protein LBU04_01870 [Christensenellaceae bacterium]|jgi:hypothetical protein|nr:hypothetical protein [Christensenellaceae bacterium]
MESKKSKMLLYLVFISISMAAFFACVTSDVPLLNAFQSSLEIDRNQQKQAIYKNIEIHDGNSLIAAYTQSYDVDLSGERPYAHLLMEERYFTIGSTNSDLRDEYTIKEGVLSIKRVIDDDEITSNYAADMDIFWTIIDENIGGNNYQLYEDCFEDLKIEENESCSMSAKVKDSKKSEFFGDETDTDSFSNVAIQINLDSHQKLLYFELTYQSVHNESLFTTKIQISAEQYHEDKNESSRKDENESFPVWAIVLISVGVAVFVVASGFAVYLFVKRKKKRTNEVGESNVSNN